VTGDVACGAGVLVAGGRGVAVGGGGLVGCGRGVFVAAGGGVFVAFGRGVLEALGRGVFVDAMGPALGLTCGVGDCGRGVAVAVCPGDWNCNAGWPSRALTMKLCQIGAAVNVDVPLGMGALLALPTHTPATSWGV
jgi:hypothetical protein